MEMENLLVKAQRNFEAGEWAQGKEYYEIAISRFYYCLYQKAIYISEKKGFAAKIKERNTQENKHEEFISKFTEQVARKLSDEEIERLSKFAPLRRARNRAEYKTKIFMKNEYHWFKFHFQNINAVLDRLKG